MIRTSACIVVRAVRATVFLVGPAVVLALALGTATTALGATGGNFILGKGNTAGAPTSLTSTLADALKSAFVVQNKSGGTALELKVGNATTPANDVAPMKVNSTSKVTNLNADLLDGKSDTDFYAAGSKVSDSAHADQAKNADTLDGRDSSDYLPGDLPGGTTLRGVFYVSDHATASGQYYYDSISFGYSQRSLPAIHYVEAGQPTPAGCSGDFANPKADPGHLCFFEFAHSAAAGNRGAFLVASAGAVVYASTNASGHLYAYGTWAVTAQ
jgi:hypothetical protein